MGHVPASALMHDDESHDIFLSYSRADTEIMLRVKGDLEAEGFRVWTDSHIAQGDADWELIIERAIENAGCLVVILSPTAKESKWVRIEVSYAEKQGKRVFPALIKGNEDSAVIAKLINTQRVDLRNEILYRSEMIKLIGGVAEHLKIGAPMLIRTQAAEVTSVSPKPELPSATTANESHEVVISHASTPTPTPTSDVLGEPILPPLMDQTKATLREFSTAIMSVWWGYRDLITFMASSPPMWHKRAIRSGLVLLPFLILSSSGLLGIIPVDLSGIESVVGNLAWSATAYLWIAFSLTIVIWIATSVPRLTIPFEVRIKLGCWADIIAFLHVLAYLVPPALVFLLLEALSPSIVIHILIILLMTIFFLLPVPIDNKIAPFWIFMIPWASVMASMSILGDMRQSHWRVSYLLVFYLQVCIYLVPMMVGKRLSKKLRDNPASTFSKIIFALLILSYAVLIYYAYFGGYKVLP